MNKCRMCGKKSFGLFCSPNCAAEYMTKYGTYGQR